jgi:hypothetical protein
MHMGRIILAGLLSGVIGVFSSWLITGVIFHPFQARTPRTWRATEGATHYAAASALTILAALVITGFFAATGGLHGVTGPISNGIYFGFLCWAALALPVILSISVFVNLDMAFVVGLLLDWLVVSLVAGGVAGWLLG